MYNSLWYIYTAIWPNTTITYKFINFPKNGLSKSAALKEIAKSFDIWAAEVPLTFQNKDEGDVDIEITFNAAKDGDGPGNTLAYAYYPVSFNGIQRKFPYLQYWCIYFSPGAMYSSMLKTGQLIAVKVSIYSL